MLNTNIIKTVGKRFVRAVMSEVTRATANTSPVITGVLERTPAIEHLEKSTKIISKPNIIENSCNVAKHFSSLEKNIINKIKNGTIETARVIDKNGNLVNDIKFIGDKYSVRLSPEYIFREGALDKFVDATYIHNHPFNSPLSSNDIYQMALLKLKKMVACTSDGGYSIMQRLKPISEINYSAFVDAAGRLISEEMQKMKSLGKIRGITDIQRMEILNQWRYERYSVFCEEFGLEFKNNISAIDCKNGIMDGNLFSVNPLQRLIDNIIRIF